MTNYSNLDLLAQNLELMAQHISVLYRTALRLGLVLKQVA